jgi:dihydrolipoamide dehydrogenase
MSETFDLIVIGAGPGGVAAAIRGTQLGAKVALVESTHWGGFCLNKACVPTKLFTATVERAMTIRSAAQMGFADAAGSIDPVALFKLKNELVGYFSLGSRGLVKAKGIVPIEGHARLAGRGRVSVGEKTYDAGAIVMATGGQWVKPSFPGSDLAEVIDSSRFLEEGGIPSRTLIAGAGPWAVETAQVLSACGSRVTIAADEGGFLTGFDQEIGQRLRSILKSDSLTVLNACRLVSVAKNKQGLDAVLTAAGKEEEERFDRVICFDRSPALQKLGLETVGLSDLQVNEHLATAAEGIWAVGDAVGRGPALSHRSSAMGIIAAENALGARLVFNSKIVPRVAFTHPQAASVGLSEEEAEEAGYEVVTGSASMGTSPMAMIQGSTNGVIKAVGEKKYGELLGVHILAPFATEIIGTAALAIQMEATLEDLARSAPPHPTISESLADAARDALGWPIYTS